MEDTSLLPAPSRAEAAEKARQAQPRRGSHLWPLSTPTGWHGRRKRPLRSVPEEEDDVIATEPAPHDDLTTALLGDDGGAARALEKLRGASTDVSAELQDLRAEAGDAATSGASAGQAGGASTLVV